MSEGRKQKQIRVRTEGDVHKLIELEELLECQLCPNERRLRVKALLTELYSWWLDPTQSDDWGVTTVIRGILREGRIQNFSTVFSFVVPQTKKIQSVFQTQQQHEQRIETRKSGPHYQIQIPHSQIGVGTKDEDLQLAIVRLCRKQEREIQHLQSGEEYSISLDVGRTAEDITLVKSVAAALVIGLRDLLAR
jgi:hypothetical protein